MRPFLSRFAAWSANLTADAIPDDVAQRARLQVNGMLAAAVAGHDHDGAALTRRLREYAPEGPCTAAGGDQFTAETAAFVNATYSMLHDFDDYLFMGHTGHSAVFASLAAAELAGVDDEALLRAVVIANELEGRLGAAVVLGPHNGQMWSFIHQAGAAAATSALLDGSTEAIAHAVGMALYNPPHTLVPGFMGGDAKALTASAPISTGMRAAMLADGGARADLGVLDGGGGLLQTYPFLALRPVLGGLGHSWVTRSVCFKPYPGCAYIQTPLEMLDDLRARTPIEAGEVDSITVRASLLTMVMESLSEAHRDWEDLPPVNATFSVPLSLAISLLDGTFGPAGLTRRAVRERVGEIRALADRIELRHDWDHTASALQGLGGGVDLGALARQVGITRVVAALVRMRREHAHFGMGGQLLRLAATGRAGMLWELFDSPLNWDHFDMARARFEALDFNFGATLEVHTRSGQTHRRRLEAHRGACGHGVDVAKQVVRDKVEQVGADRVQQLCRGIDGMASLAG